MRPPSYSVPRYFSYQSITITWPSGLIDGMSSSTTSSIQAVLAGSSVVANCQTNSIAIWVEPTSVEWMVQVTRAIALPSAMSSSASSGVSSSGLARRRAISRQRSRRARLAAEVRTTTGISLPSVEVPATSIVTRSEAASTSRRYSSTFGHGASLRSAPTRWPRNSSGVGGVAAPAAPARQSARTVIARVRRMGTSDGSAEGLWTARSRREG